MPVQRRNIALHRFYSATCSNVEYRSYDTILNKEATVFYKISYLKKTSLLLIVLFFGIAPADNAVAVDGNWGLTNCQYFIKALDNSVEKKEITNEKNVKAFQCAGFVGGFKDSIFTYQLILKDQGTRPLICLPSDSISDVKAIRIVLKHLGEHPEVLHLDLGALEWAALAISFPCPK